MRGIMRLERSLGPLPLQQSAAEGALTQGRGYRGHIVAYRTGHPHNAQLVQLLALQMQTVLPRQRRAA